VWLSAITSLKWNAGSKALSFEIEQYSPLWRRWSKEVLANPILIARNEKEQCLIETSINSVRISVKIKQADEMESLLTRKLAGFVTRRADHFIVLRRKAVEVCHIIAHQVHPELFTGL